VTFSGWPYRREDGAAALLIFPTMYSTVGGGLLLASAIAVAFIPRSATAPKEREPTP